jgi:PAS domain S-box-containing protein
VDTDDTRDVVDLLAASLAIPVATIQDVPAVLQQPVLSALGESTREIRPINVDGRRYLACRYYHQRRTVLLLGPYRTPADPPAEIATLDPTAEARATETMRLAVQMLGRAMESERQRSELASQFEVTNRAVLAITSELALETVLHRIVDLARELSGARYGALGVPSPAGDLEAFLTSGMSAEQEARIPHRPRGLGILGLLLREPHTLRLKDLHEHPASVGFPRNHPPMTSFLGVPIMSRGRVLGNLYLTEKRTGGEFTDGDARLVEILARHAAVAIDNAHLYQEIEQQQRRLQLILDQLPEATLLTESDPERVTLANRHASDVLGWTIQTPMLLDDFLQRNPRKNPEGSPLPMEAVPVVRSLRQGETVNRTEMQIARPDGRHITVLVNSVPLLDQDERVTGAITVFQDITQIKDAEQLKDEFLSLVSHELRTPLTTIQGGALMLQRDWEALNLETQQQCLADIATESRRLGILIDNMVQLANIRAGRMRMETEPVHVRIVIERAVAGIQHLAPQRRFEIEFAPNLLAEADPARIDQVIRNLLHNAIKYSPDDAPIDVSASAEGGMIRIEVRDHGPGIDSADIPGLFDRFSRSDRAIASGTPGLGLGLYLSQHVIHAHGGRIWVECPDDGGTRFVFTLPAIDDEL